MADAAMVYRLGEHVVCGELFNTRRNCVHGWLGLRDVERPVVFELTGNCAPDLAGKHIRFHTRDRPADDESPIEHSEEEERARMEEMGLSGLAWRQIGPTGTMTADREVLASDCPPLEFYRRSELGERPPTVRKRCLYLEWHGQNGRTVVELVDPVIEFVDDSREKQAERTPSVSEEPAPDGLAEPASDDEPITFGGPDEAPEERTWIAIPESLQQQLDAQASELDRTIRGESESDNETIRELELMDHLIETSEGNPLGTLFDDVVKLPSPATLDEAGAEAALKDVLARLAVHGVALHMCEHFTALAAYRLLIEDLCKEQTAYPELRGTSWVQHFDTAEFCPECQAQFDREYEEHYRNLEGNAGEDDAGSTDGKPPPHEPPF